jgi:outer membrane protein assembly factor BamE
MRRLLPTVLLLVVVLASGCSNLVYKPEVQQGVLLSTEMLEKLRIGMTKRQVRLLLGTAPISDAFHPERWDYVYYVGKADEKISPTHLTLFFQNDALARIEGNLAPATPEKPVSGATDNTPPVSTDASAPR